jgi:hypothetical protein
MAPISAATGKGAASRWAIGVDVTLGSSFPAGHPRDRRHGWQLWPPQADLS